MSDSIDSRLVSLKGKLERPEARPVLEPASPTAPEPEQGERGTRRPSAPAPTSPRKPRASAPRGRTGGDARSPVRVPVRVEPGLSAAVRSQAAHRGQTLGTFVLETVAAAVAAGSLTPALEAPAAGRVVGGLFPVPAERGPAQATITLDLRVTKGAVEVLDKLVDDLGFPNRSALVVAALQRAATAWSR